MSIQKLEGTPIAGGAIRFGGNEYQSTLVDNQPDRAGGIDVGEIIFTLTRHKWKIILLGMMGVSAAAATYLKHEASYQTNAKLLVRYVLERNTVDTEIQSSVRETTGRTGASVLQDEMEILTSWDLAREVAEAVGVESLVTKNPEIESDTDFTVAAANSIINNLGVSNGRNSNVISVSYQNGDPEVAVTVLNEMITRYFDKHLEIHRPVGASEFIAEQTRKVNEKLQEIEDELNRLKRQAGKGALAGNTSGFDSANIDGSRSPETSWWSGLASWASTRQDLLNAESERAAQTARLGVLEEVVGRISEAGPVTEEAPVQPSESELAKYLSLVEQLAQMRLRNANLRQKFPPGSRLITVNESEIKSAEAQRSALVAKYPVLTTIATDENAIEEQTIDIAAERMLLAATEARIKVLKSKVAEVQEAEENMPILLSKIHDLQRLKASEEEKYFYLTSEVEKAQIDGMLDPSKMPNITVIQSASPPVKVLDPRFKGIILMLAGSGFALGMGLALLKELFLDRRIKRPADFEKRLSIPLMLTIPLLPLDRRKALPKKSTASNGNGSDKSNGSSNSFDLLDSTDPNEARFWPYAAAIRDRVFSHFLTEESQSGPRMVALTGFTQGSGTSTLAKSVATMYAATREKVLLIDMNVSGTDPYSIYEAETKLKSASRNRQGVDSSGSPVPAGEQDGSNLFEADGPSPRIDIWDQSVLMISAKNSGSVSPKDLYNLLPLIRQSDYSYVIFDMPPVAPTSPTNAMAGFMDIVLLIVDATRTDRDVVKRGYEELLKVNSHVTCIYNKATETGPGDRLDVVAERRRQLVEGMVR